MLVCGWFRLLQEFLAMPTYRIYTIGRDRRVSGPAEFVECADDQEAIRKAQQAVNGYDVELWDGPRLVVRLPHDPPK
jgi:hypothetical protein